MPDHAHSENAAVQTQLDRLAALGPGRDTLGLERISALLARLDNPHLRLPPVFHVAGTNGKGSTCAFLRASLEADGKTVHVYTSPHLVRFNERIRVAGSLISDDYLAQLLARVLDVSDPIGPSFFEATTAAAFLAFAETPADACVIEVGLGGRLDATNVILRPAATGIAALGMDHEAFLLAAEDGTPINPLCRIAWEKAGIAKPQVPLVCQKYRGDMAETVADHAASVDAPLFARGMAWDVAIYADQLHYRDAAGKISLPLPALAGPHQAENAGLAIAMLRHQNAVQVSNAALKAAMGWTKWPGRMQRLEPGPLTALLRDANIWLDGGHNPSAGEAIAAAMADAAPFHLVMGMLANKDIAGFMAPLLPLLASVTVIPVPHHEHHDPDVLVQVIRQSLTGKMVEPAADVVAALNRLAQRKLALPKNILIAGSLYLAGEVLRENGQIPE